MTLSKNDPIDNTDDYKSQLSKLNSDSEINSINIPRKEQQSDTSEVYQVSLLEEKLKVARYRQKIGEVIVRKQVETRMIQVPIKREKLVVERIGQNPEILTEVVIGEEKLNGFNYPELSDTDSLHVTKSNFLDLPTAEKLLEAIRHLSSADNARVRLEIVTNCSEHQIEHQNICNRYQ